MPGMNIGHDYHTTPAGQYTKIQEPAVNNNSALTQTLKGVQNSVKTPGSEKYFTQRTEVNDIARVIGHIGDKILEDNSINFVKASSKTEALIAIIKSKVNSLEADKQVCQMEIERDNQQVATHKRYISELSTLQSRYVRINFKGSFTAINNNLSGLIARLFNSEYQASIKRVDEQFETRSRHTILQRMHVKIDNLDRQIASQQQKIHTLDQKINAYQAHEKKLLSANNYFHQQANGLSAHRVKAPAPLPPAAAKLSR
ncbi:hypothetical protein [Pantoea sp. B65]|uniref:hypothetical protein n=1 Tax=Pantoea sp. B65 TaxID=2813359 RepID=UPI0039B59A94